MVAENMSLCQGYVSQSNFSFISTINIQENWRTLNLFIKLQRTFLLDNN